MRRIMLITALAFCCSLVGCREPSDKSAGDSAAAYQFAESENTACFTCRHVVREGAAILRVTHDADDGGWQFLCGGDHAEDDALILGMGEIVRIDPSVNGLHEMPEGVGASRESREGEWTTFKRQ